MVFFLGLLLIFFLVFFVLFLVLSLVTFFAAARDILHGIYNVYIVLGLGSALHYLHTV